MKAVGRKSKISKKEAIKASIPPLPPIAELRYSSTDEERVGQRQKENWSQMYEVEFPDFMKELEKA